MASRFLDAHRRMMARGPREPSPTPMPAAIVAAIGAEKAAAIASGAELSREWQALHHRAEVERMSLAGTPVAKIAAELDLSTRHVVALRAQLGVGRRR